MKRLNKILEYFGLYNGGEDSAAEETVPQEKEAGKVVPMFGGSWRERDREEEPLTPPSFDSYETSVHKSYEEESKTPSPSLRGDKVLSMPVNRNPVSVVVIEPIDFNDSQKMADYLCKNQPVVINFEETDREVRKRIIDFVSGTIYALDGTLRKIGRNLLVCAPPNVDIDTENTNLQEGNQPWEQ